MSEHIAPRWYRVPPCAGLYWYRVIPSEINRVTQVWLHPYSKKLLAGCADGDNKAVDTFRRWWFGPLLEPDTEPPP